MPLPDPDLYTDWRAWAKARNQKDTLETRRESNWIAEYGLITDFESNWTSDPDNPASFCLLKNGFVSLAGSIEATDHVAYNTMFTLPHAARPLTGHDFGAGELLITYVSIYIAGAASNVYCFVKANGQVKGTFNLSSQASVLFLHDISYRGQMAR